MKTSLYGVGFFRLRYLTLITILLTVSYTFEVKAQGDGPRFYWKSLMGTNAVPLIFNSMGGNANPLDPAHTVVPGSEFTATMAMAGYAKMLPVGKRSAMISLTVPMGRINGDVSLNGLDYTSSSRGFGDPMIQFDMNIIGPKAMMNIPDMIRYKPGFSVDVMASIAAPLGNYDNESPINIGQNRWYGRVGAPVVWQLGPWVPGKRTTFEFLPAVWFFTDNTDFVGKTLKTEPMYQLEAHLTRDFMERMWGSLDVVSFTGGKATIDDVEGNELSNLGAGITLGYDINENMHLNFSYMSTVNDEDAEDLKMDGFRVTLLFGWHPLVEGMRRLKEGH